MRLRWKLRRLGTLRFSTIKLIAATNKEVLYKGEIKVDYCIISTEFFFIKNIIEQKLACFSKTNWDTEDLIRDPEYWQKASKTGVLNYYARTLPEPFAH